MQACWPYSESGFVFSSRVLVSVVHLYPVGTLTIGLPWKSTCYRSPVAAQMGSWCKWLVCISNLWTKETVSGRFWDILSSLNICIVLRWRFIYLVQYSTLLKTTFILWFSHSWPLKLSPVPYSCKLWHSHTCMVLQVHVLELPWGNLLLAGGMCVCVGRCWIVDSYCTLPQNAEWCSATPPNNVPPFLSW